MIWPLDDPEELARALTARFEELAKASTQRDLALHGALQAMIIVLCDRTGLIDGKDLGQTLETIAEAAGRRIQAIGSEASEPNSHLKALAAFARGERGPQFAVIAGGKAEPE